MNSRVAYVNKCENRDLDAYMSDCWTSVDTIESNIINDAPSVDSNIRDSTLPEPVVSIQIPYPAARIPIMMTNFAPIPYQASQTNLITNRQVSMMPAIQPYHYIVNPYHYPLAGNIIQTPRVILRK